MIEDGDEQSTDDNDDDEDLEEAKAATKKSASATKESDRRKRELITMGKAKGFLTYDEVNDHMPESIVSSDQIDDWLSSLGDEGIEVVDSGPGGSGAVKLPARAAASAVRAPATPVIPDVIEEDAEEPAAAAEEAPEK